MVFPVHSLEPTKPIEDANAQVTLTNLPPNTKVVWWASKAGALKEEAIVPSPNLAYNHSQNSGIVKTDEHGTVVIKLHCPVSYAVRMGTHILPKHIHYRYEIRVNGFDSFLSRVYTSNVHCSQ